MSLVDRINRLILGRMRSRETVSVAGDTLRVGETGVALAALDGAVAHEVDLRAGRLIAVTLSFDGRTVTVNQEDECWEDLLDALDRLGLTAMPSPDWTTEVLAAASGGRPIVLRRDGRPSR